MKMTDLFLGELEREGPLTRRALERVPEGRNDWKPHEKSMPLGRLAALVAGMPAWITMNDLVKMMDDGVAGARSALQRTNDDHLMKPWRLLVAGKTVSEQPRHIMLRDSINHLAHHRGQLTVYLRLNDVPVPAIYGPSADDQRFG